MSSLTGIAWRTTRSRSWASAASGSAPLSALFTGGSDDDPLFLQAKQAEASVYERYLGPSEHASHGERVVTGQRRLQAASDILLGWTVGERGQHVYVRQLQDQKGSAVIDTMTARGARDLGRTLRVGPRPRSCPVGRPCHDRRLPRDRQRVRARDGDVRRGLRGPERAGPCGPAGRDQERSDPGRAGSLNRARWHTSAADPLACRVDRWNTRAVAASIRSPRPRGYRRSNRPRCWVSAPMPLIGRL